MDDGEQQRTRTQRRERLRRASRTLPEGPHGSIADELDRVATWCRAHDVDADRYGDGVFLESFETDVAALLGHESARFMPSGTMAQQVALRVWCDRVGRRVVGLHPTSHLELHEERAHVHLHGLRSSVVGDRVRPMVAGDLAAVAEPLAAIVVELPTRENGGQLPSWDELVALCDLARERSIHCHLDGARLWEAAAGLGRQLDEICGLFDSVYVSFYKGIGALPGSMLLGPADVIDEAAVWQRRHGGNLYTLTPAAASAAMRLHDRIARMPAHLHRAREVADVLAAVDGVRVLPGAPHVNMFHLLLDVDPERLATARDGIAETDGIWWTNGAVAGEVPGTARTEIIVGDGADSIGDDEIRAGFPRLLAAAAAS